MDENKTVNTMVQEISRGTVTLAVLLTTEDAVYGYSLATSLRDSGLDVEQNTLYPLLRRLESQGFLSSTWDTGESRPRKYYRRTEEGRRVGMLLADEWRRLNDVMKRLVDAPEAKE